MSDEHPISSSSQTNPSTTTVPSDTTSTTTTNSTTTVTTVTNDNNTSSSVLIGLQIKSLEQRTHSVTLPRNSSVLQLKNEIQSTLDVDSGRQRLIFQGKVLKDDKNLMDYANLDDGKVIHLVIRPLDAPQNPLNDEPRPAGRRVFGNRGRSFPSIASRLPMMEGYTFITLDAHIGDNGDSNSFFSSIMNGLTGANPFNGTSSTQNGRSIRTFPNPSTTGQQQQQQQEQEQEQEQRQHSAITSNLLPSFLTRSPFELRRSLENASNTDNSNSSISSNIASTTTGNNNTNNNNSNDGDDDAPSNTTRSSIRLPLPSSVEMRLSRSVAYIRNVSNILEAPADQQMSQIPYTSASSPEFIQEIRSTLRGNGNSQSYQVGMVMNELSDLMERGTPWLRETARNLQNEGAQSNNEENIQLYRRVLRAARVIQGMSLINHFMGSVLTSVDMDGQRANGQETTRTSMFDPPISGDSWHSSGNEELQSSSSTSNDQTLSSVSRTTIATADSLPASSSSSSSSPTTTTTSASASTVTASASNTIISSPGSKEAEESLSIMEVDKNGNKRKRDEESQEETINKKQQHSEKGKSKNKKD